MQIKNENYGYEKNLSKRKERLARRSLPDLFHGEEELNTAKLTTEQKRRRYAAHYLPQQYSKHITVTHAM